MNTTPDFQINYGNMNFAGQSRASRTMRHLCGNRCHDRAALQR